jgi:hypothetical protein
MTADAAVPGLLTIAVRRAPMQDGAMLYDAFRLSNADPALFDTAVRYRNWIEKGADGQEFQTAFLLRGRRAKVRSEREREAAAHLGARSRRLEWQRGR